METTCHSGSTGLSLLPWPCPGHINPSDRIARTCPSFWVSIYTTWQSLWPSLTQCSKKDSGKKAYFGTVGCLEETEFFHLFALFWHTFTVLKRKCCSNNIKLAECQNFRGEKCSQLIFLPWLDFKSKNITIQTKQQKEEKLKGFDKKGP